MEHSHLFVTTSLLAQTGSNDLMIRRQCHLTDIILVFPTDANCGIQVFSDPHKARLLQQGAGGKTATV